MAKCIPDSITYKDFDSTVCYSDSDSDDELMFVSDHSLSDWYSDDVEVVMHIP